MGTRDYYLDEENAAIREAYKEYLKKVFRPLSGVAEEELAEAAEGVMRVETELARSQWSNRRAAQRGRTLQPHVARRVREDLRRRGLGYLLQSDGCGRLRPHHRGDPVGRGRCQRGAEERTLADLRYYLASQYINSAASFLSDDFHAASFDFFGKAMTGTPEPRARWKRAMSVPNGTLLRGRGRDLRRTLLPESDKERMTQLVRNLQTALGEHIDALEWMSDETKARAREKLAAFTVKIGYPDTWKDYSSLDIDPGEELLGENIVNANIWYNRREPWASWANPWIRTSGTCRPRR